MEKQLIIKYATLGTFAISIQVDLEKVARRMGYDAIHSKKKVSKKMQGLITVKCLGEVSSWKNSII